MGRLLLSFFLLGAGVQSEEEAAPERTSFLASVEVGPDQRSGDVICILCSVRVLGRAAEVVTVGGNVVVAGSVEGDVVAAGGDITLLSGASVGEDAVAVGGRVYRDPSVETGEISEIPYFHLAGQRAFHWEGLLVFVGSAFLMGAIGFLLLGSKRINRMVETWRFQPWILILLGVLSAMALILSYTKADLAGSWEDFITRILQGFFLVSCWMGFLTLSQALGGFLGRAANWSRFAVGCGAATILLLVPVVGFFLFFLLFPMGVASVLGSGMGAETGWLAARLFKRKGDIRRLGCVLLLLLVSAGGPVRGEDWPEWRGKGRLGIWTEAGILEEFSGEELEPSWSVPIDSGYAGPAVADGRVFVLDFRQDEETREMSGTERLLCIDETTGKVLWSREWKTSYSSLMASYATGPRATPTVSGNRVYTVGATGILRSFDVASGDLIWHTNYPEDFGTRVPIWGVSSAPLVENGLLIALVGGAGNAQVVAFDKESGKERWRALSAEPEMGYAQPIVFEHGGVRQLIVWTPRALASLNPGDGTVYWEIPFDAPSGLTVATPILNGSRLFVSQFYGGSLMVDLNPQKPAARELWRRKGRSERPDGTDALHALITTPVMQGSHIYGVCSYGQLRCLDAGTGNRIWESLDLIELSRWAAAFIVRNGDRYFINTDKGDLVIATFSPEGFREMGRAKLLEPTTNSAWGSRPGRPRRNDRLVNWSHPAYANGHIVARNDEKIVRVSLQSDGAAER